MDGVAVMGRVVDENTRLVNTMTTEQFAAPTSCDGWVVRDLVNHITGGSTMFAVSVETGSVPDDMLGLLMGGDNLGDDPASAWKQASTQAMAAFGLPGALDRVLAFAGRRPRITTAF